MIFKLCSSHKTNARGNCSSSGIVVLALVLKNILGAYSLSFSQKMIDLLVYKCLLSTQVPFFCKMSESGLLSNTVCCLFMLPHKFRKKCCLTKLSRRNSRCFQSKENHEFTFPYGGYCRSSQPVVSLTIGLGPICRRK
jgi:hypothetical protein